jgi:hypothetical protein
MFVLFDKISLDGYFIKLFGSEHFCKRECDAKISRGNIPKMIQQEEQDVHQK